MLLDQFTKLIHIIYILMKLALLNIFLNHQVPHDVSNFTTKRSHTHSASP
jgi:hypothetical protein